MKYRLDKDHLLNVLEEWNHFLKRKVHLIACEGTAMILSGVKPSTKDDCLSLTEAHRANLDIDRLVGHFNELVSFDVAEARLRPHMQHFLELLQKRGLYD